MCKLSYTRSLWYICLEGKDGAHYWKIFDEYINLLIFAEWRVLTLALFLKVTPYIWFPGRAWASYDALENANGSFVKNKLDLLNKEYIVFDRNLLFVIMLDIFVVEIIFISFVWNHWDLIHVKRANVSFVGFFSICELLRDMILLNLCNFDCMFGKV